MVAEAEHGEGDQDLGCVEAVGAAGDQADLAVDLLDPGVRESVLDRGLDPGALFGDRLGELDERGQGPCEPGIEDADASWWVTR